MIKNIISFIKIAIRYFGLITDLKLRINLFIHNVVIPVKKNILFLINDDNLNKFIDTDDLITLSNIIIEAQMIEVNLLKLKSKISFKDFMKPDIYTIMAKTVNTLNLSISRVEKMNIEANQLIEKTLTKIS